MWRLTNHRAGSDGVQRNIQKFLEALAAVSGMPVEQMTPTETRAILVGTQSRAASDLPKADGSERTVTSDAQTVKIVVKRPVRITGTVPVVFFPSGGWVLDARTPRP